MLTSAFAAFLVYTPDDTPRKGDGSQNWAHRSINICFSWFWRLNTDGLRASEKSCSAHLLKRHLTRRAERWACDLSQALDIDMGSSSFDERGSAGDIHQKICSGVFGLHAMKTATLSEHCVFVGHDEEIISEAAAASVWSSIHYFFLRGSCRSLLGEMQESFFIWVNASFYFSSDFMPLDCVWFLKGICVSLSLFPRLLGFPINMRWRWWWQLFVERETLMVELQINKTLVYAMKSQTKSIQN